MMGKTHLAMGVAVATLVLCPTDVSSCLIVVSGGALGGIVADIDTVKNDYENDALIAQLIAIAVFGLSLMIAWFLGGRMVSELVNGNRILFKIGLIAYFILLFVGFCSPHRTFTHSILALVLFSLAIALICPCLVKAYIIGYIVHLLLDILNKKPVPLLFPKGKGVCLGLCYASEIANTCFMWIGFIGSIFLILNSLLLHIF